jgi:hypothetical protein
MKMEQTVCSETLAHEIQMPGNLPNERIQQKAVRLLMFSLNVEIG